MNAKQIGAAALLVLIGYFFLPVFGIPMTPTNQFILILVCAGIGKVFGEAMWKQRPTQTRQQPQQKKQSATRGAIFGAAAAYNDYKKQEAARNAARVAKEQAEKDREFREEAQWRAQQRMNK